MHTPGPWHRSSSVATHFIDSRKRIIGEVRVDQNVEFDEAMDNACLIVHAPELLRALKNCERWFNDHRALLGNPDVLETTEYAIKKAEGIA